MVVVRSEASVDTIVVLPCSSVVVETDAKKKKIKVIESIFFCQQMMGSQFWYRSGISRSDDRLSRFLWDLQLFFMKAS